ncbi:MAG: PAS domain S-box protein [Reyranella sp.]
MLNEQRFQEFALMGADWFWETDSAGRFTYFSTAETQQGLDLVGFLGRVRSDFVRKDPDNLARLECIDAKVRARESFRNLPYVVSYGDGPARWCEISGNPKFDSTTGAFDGYRGVGRDITALVEAREALEQRQAELQRQSDLLQVIFANVPAGIAVYNRKSELIAWNERWIEIVGVDPSIVRFGVTAHEIIAARASAGEYGPGVDPEALADQVAARLLAGEMDFAEHVRPNGLAFEMHRGRLPEGGSVSIYLDVTERKRSERERQEAAQALADLNETLERRISERTVELAESDRFQRTLMSNVPGMVYRTIKEGALWTVEFASEGSRGLIGVAPEDLMSGRIQAQMLIHPDEHAAVRAKVKADLDLGDSFEAEYRVRRADGKWRWVLDRARAIRSESGEVLALEGVVLDIDDRKMVEQQLHQAQRMEAIGQLTGGLAHDFNNYLAVILGNLDMLAERGQGDAEATKLVEAAISGAQRGAELTRSLLAFSRRQPLDPKVLDIGERIGDVVRLLRRTVGERIALELRVAPNLWPVKIDGAQLDSTMINLANNARDAMPSGGTVTIEVLNAPGDMVDAPAGDHVLVEVRDCGGGMDAATLAKAFDPFFSTKGAGRGSGLGLSMVHGFVHQSGGAIRLASIVGKGTTVRLFLPRSVVQSAILVKPAVSKYPRGTESVILVDDNDAVRETVAETLKSLGYRVTEAVSGDAALKLLEESAGRFDLVMSDMVMPGRIDGPALGRIVRQRWTALGVLLTTGYAGDPDANTPERVADFDILTKPFRKEDLARVIRRAIEKAR